MWATSNVLYLHLTLVPYLGTSNEFKTKPTQHSVATLRSVGHQPRHRDGPQQGEAARGHHPQDRAVYQRAAPTGCFPVTTCRTSTRCRWPWKSRDWARPLKDLLSLEHIHPNLGVWQNAVRVIKAPQQEVTIALAGKYTAMPDAYL